MEFDTEGNLIITVVCCREWPVFRIFQSRIYGWGKCGICGQVPEYKRAD